MTQTLILVVGGIAGAISTFLLQKYGLSAVVASCLVGLVGALFGKVFHSTHLPIVIFTGSFVGMTSISLGSIPLILLGGAISGLVYQLTLNLFPGYGGRLGTIAFISTILSVSFFQLLQNYSPFRKK